MDDRSRLQPLSCAGSVFGDKVSTNEEWDRQHRHKIDLTLDLVPKGDNTKAETAQAAARLPREIRERALAGMLRPEEGDFDETGRGDEGRPWKRSGREIKDFKWRLILDLDPKR